MPRSPNDATRFTATGPYMSSKPPGGTDFASNGLPTAANTAPTGLRIDFGTAPANESAQQKIARLRAAAAASRRGKESQFDTVVRVGRVWADRAHRATAIGLIGLTVVAGVVATAGITDMLMHNRRRRNEWLAEQQMKTAVATAEARQAMSQGRATEDQMLLINRERAAAEAAEAKRNRPGMFKRAGSYLFGELDKEEQKGGRLGAAASKIEQTVQPVKDELLGEKEDLGILKTVEEKVESHRRQGEKAAEVVKPLGGPLDRQAEMAASTLSDTSKSWTSWFTRK